MSIPIPWASEASDFGLQKPKFVFSADGSKCAFAMNFGRVSVWDIRSKEIFIALHYNHHIRYLQFSSGKLGREVLVFAVVRLIFTFWYPYFSNRWSESLARFFIPSWHHSCNRCNIVWDGRKNFLQGKTAVRSWIIYGSGFAFFRSKRGNSIRCSWRNTPWMGPAEKQVWFWMVDRGGVGCPPLQKCLLLCRL